MEAIGVDESGANVEKDTAVTKTGIRKSVEA